MILMTRKFVLGYCSNEIVRFCAHDSMTTRSWTNNLRLSHINSGVLLMCLEVLNSVTMHVMRPRRLLEIDIAITNVCAMVNPSVSDVPRSQIYLVLAFGALSLVSFSSTEPWAE